MGSVFITLLRTCSADSFKKSPPLRVAPEEEPIVMPSWMHPREIFASNGSGSPPPTRSSKRKVVATKQKDFPPSTLPASNETESVHPPDITFSSNGATPDDTAASDTPGMSPNVISAEPPAHHLPPKFPSTNILPPTNGAPRRSTLLRQASAMAEISGPALADVQRDRWQYLWETQQKVGQVKGIAEGEDDWNDFPSFPKPRRGPGAGAGERKLGFKDRSQSAAPDFASFLTKT